MLLTLLLSYVMYHEKVLRLCQRKVFFVNLLAVDIFGLFQHISFVWDWIINILLIFIVPIEFSQFNYIWRYEYPTLFVFIVCYRCIHTAYNVLCAERTSHVPSLSPATVAPLTVKWSSSAGCAGWWERARTPCTIT